MKIRLPIPVLVALLCYAAIFIDPSKITIPSILPNDPPIKEAGLRVLVVEETEDRDNLPKDQVNIMLGTAWRQYVNSHQGDYRQLDDDAVITKEESWVQEGMKLPRTTLPWLIISNGKSGVSMPFPQKAEELMEQLKRYGEP